MRLLCLYFPDLAITLARRAHPHLAERPIALIDGAGPEAVVTAVSPAAARTIHPRMLAGDSRQRCPGAVFLPSNAGACLDELERLATIIAKYATESVAIESTSHLLVDVTGARDEVRTAQRLRSLARAWSDMVVQAGIGSTRRDALQAAMSSRRIVVAVPPRTASEPALRRMEGPISVTLYLDGSAAGRLRIGAALHRLAAVQEAAGRSFRDVRLTLATDAETHSLRIRCDRPLNVDDVRERIVAAVGRLPQGVSGTLTVALELLGPPVRVYALPALAAAG